MTWKSSADTAAAMVEAILARRGHCPECLRRQAASYDSDADILEAGGDAEEAGVFRSIAKRLRAAAEEGS